MSKTCPYCQERCANSEDHIFSQFLGGKKTIPSCTNCNKKFGSTFEGKVSQDLMPIIYQLVKQGYKHPSSLKADRIIIDKDGNEYNGDKEGNLFPVNPYKEDGKVKQKIFRNKKEAEKHIEVLSKRRGKDIPVNMSDEFVTIEQPQYRLVKVGTEIRQLTVKMCVALGQHFLPTVNIVDDKHRSFLLGESLGHDILKVYSRYSSAGLDKLRPVLAHVIFVEANSERGLCHGLVQFFGGTLQFYVPLNSNYIGKDFAVLATLDILDMKERFLSIEPLNLLALPSVIAKEQAQGIESEHLRFFETQIKAFNDKMSLEVTL